MNKFLISLAALSFAGMAMAQDATKLYDPMQEQAKVVIPVELLAKDGNKAIGNVVAVNTKYGVGLYPNLKGLTPGVHGFHVHQNPDCGLSDKGLGMKAGGSL